MVSSAVGWLNPVVYIALLKNKSPLELLAYCLREDLSLTSAKALMSLRVANRLDLGTQALGSQNSVPCHFCAASPGGSGTEELGLSPFYLFSPSDAGFLSCGDFIHIN